MTSPYYTNLDAGSGVIVSGGTAGPADSSAPAVQKVYTVITGLLGIVGIASTFGLITNEQSANLGSVATAVTTLVGASITALASFRTKKQIKNGTFDPAPPPVIVQKDLTSDAFQALSDISAKVDDTVKAATASVHSAVGMIQGAVNLIPGASAVINNPLVDEFLNRP